MKRQTYNIIMICFLTGIFLCCLVACQPHNDSFSSVQINNTSEPKLTVYTQVSDHDAETTSPTTSEVVSNFHEFIPTISPTPGPSPTPTMTFTDDPYRNHPLPTHTFTPTPTISYAEGVNPLTGLVVKSQENLDRKPIFIKVSNYPPYGRPHAGLSAADIVFEYYIGEGANRFTAVYYGNNAKSVGPIRSGRLVDAQLVELYHGFLVYGGADDRVDSVLINVLGERAIDVTNEHPCPPICGTDTHSETGVFADSSIISEYVEDLGFDNSQPNLNGMSFSSDTPAGEVATFIGVQFSSFCRGEWRYDEKADEYLRWIEQDLDIDIMVPLVDRNTGNQLSFANILILYADYVIYTPTLYDIQIWQNSNGLPAILFRDGIKQEATWKVIDDQHPIQLLDSQDNLLDLKPGNTWIVLFSTQSTIQSKSEGVWEARFALP